VNEARKHREVNEGEKFRKKNNFRRVPIISRKTMIPSICVDEF
jgi:hypothetical protein